MTRKIDTSKWPRDKYGNPYWYDKEEVKAKFRFMAEREAEIRKEIVEENNNKRKHNNLWQHI